MSLDFQDYVDNINGMAGIYAFDILPDGSYSEVRLMAIRGGVLGLGPDAPKFYPGIPWRKYYTDLNFESYIYRCGSSGEFLYSYANAHGHWVKGFYTPLISPENEAEKQTKTCYCLYTGTYSTQFEFDAMSGHSPEVSSAVMNISVRLHETQNFHQAMSAAVGELQKVCGAKKCALYTVNNSNQHCNLITAEGVRRDYLEAFSEEMKLSPYEIACAWENDLDGSDCLLPDTLSVVQERDPKWYDSLKRHGVHNMILCGVRFNQILLGFIWAADYDAARTVLIKETLELTSFLIAASIANHQLVSRLELKSTVDGLTQVNNRNALNDRIEKFISGAEKLPAVIGVAFADLNGLKTVNDNDGHDAGDKLLARAGSLLRLAFGEDEIYRAGGDEFVILCPDITEEKLNQQIRQLRSLADSTPDVSFAIGSVHVSDTYDIREVMRMADERMYQDKQEYYRLHPEKDRRRQGR